MNLDLFDSRKSNNNDFTSKFIKELTNALKNMINEGKNMNEKQNIENNYDLNKKGNVLEEYNLYEIRKIFLDNKSRRGNDLAWIIDENSACISEHGDGGAYFLSETELPKNVKVGEVYEKINGKYVYNEEITKEIANIVK